MSNNKPLKLSIPRWAQVVLYLIIFVFLVSSLAAGWEQIQDFDWQITPLPLLLSFFVGAFYLSGRGALWTWNVKQLDIALSYRDGIRMWLTAHLSRYVPGGIWPYATVATTSNQLNLPGSVLTALFILHFLFVIWVNSLLALPLLFVWFADSPFRFDILIPVVFLIGTIAMPMVLRKMLTWIIRWRKISVPINIDKLTAPYTMFRTFGLFMGLQLTYLCLFFFVINGLIDINAAKAAYLSLAYLNSWFIGLLVLFVPQGLGVRESVFAILAAPFIPSAVAVALSAGLRLLTIAHDLSLLVILLLGTKWNGKTLQYND